MANPFIRKLDGFEKIHDEDRDWLISMTRNVVEVEANRDLIREGDNPEIVHLVLEGLAVRYKSTLEGRRHIFAYMIPGDFCDLHVALLRRMDHSIATVTPCRVVKLPPAVIIEMTERRPSLARALWMCSLVDEATLREWLVNIGQRSASQRIAHLFCELHVRMKAVGLTTDGGFELPLTQEEIADTMGLSNVHVNRSLKELRYANLVTLKNEMIAIPNVDVLKRYSSFDPSYLHIERTRSVRI
ncbi:Crp/Fnr family transcriptional regulator [Aureimonas glaciei]|uniref:Crp/Fnr family transcriptional regulator n=1 Tax=Aureimonas glaciei TaxID=1776957 RepID=A0A916Y2T5_9HYPH|nr:Crp/Fnr family transcriptional regulator [Aureimonas glaciei]GGD28766.1 Crp/Fnr family transcriptional regulator [Aureimonas glaciei]